MRSASALTALRRVILANTETPDEVRHYIEEHIVDLVLDLGVTTDTITSMLEVVKDDSELAKKTLVAVKKVQASQRDHKRAGRARAAQAAAETLALRAVFDGDRVQIDLPGLLSTALTKRGDLIVFSTADFKVSVPQAILLDVAKLKRRDLSGFVDANGLHIRWPTGGLNLCSQSDPHADRIVLNLSLKATAVAA